MTTRLHARPMPDGTLPAGGGADAGALSGALDLDLPGALDLDLPGDDPTRREVPGEVEPNAQLRLAEGAAGSLAVAIEVARGSGGPVPLPGGGHTARRWEFLARLGAADLSVARVVEAHLDALAILAEAGADHAGSGAVDVSGGADTWGVFAAEGKGVSAHAARTADGWRLSGVKPWCSAASALDRALVTARTPSGSGLFAIDLHAEGVVVQRDTWFARGLVDVGSGPVELHDVPAVPVGEPGWYVQRDGMAWGGMGVAACWFGGAVGVARQLWQAADERAPDDIALMHLGAVDATLDLTRTRLAVAAAQVDAGAASGLAGRIVAQRVRGAVARCVDEVLLRAGHGLGPGPLALDDDHARRVADLQLYVRQHHAERDDVATGRLLLEAGRSPW